MARYSGSHNPTDVVELLFEELRTFRAETREDYKQLNQAIAEQNRMISTHSEQMVELIQIIHGNGNKGLVDRISALEKNQEEFKQKFADIETREKVRAAVLGVICAICSSIGGIITYLVSLYFSIGK